MRIELSMAHLLTLPGQDLNNGLARLPLALVQAGSFIRSKEMSFRKYAAMYQGTWNDLSQVLEKAVDSGVVHNDQRAIWTTWRVSMEALDEISRLVIRAVAMLGVGEVPECLMSRVLNECVADGSENNDSSIFFRVVKGDLVNGSSLLSEEAKRGSFRLHPLIRQYVRFDAGPTARVCQDIALRAVHGTVIQQQVQQYPTGDLSAQKSIRSFLTLAPHAIAVVQDQVDARKLEQAEEHKFVEVTEPLAELAVRALSWSRRAVAVETLCTSLLEFLCWAQTERDTRVQYTSRLMGTFKSGRSAYFSRRKIRLCISKYRLARCNARIDRGNFVGAESDARNVLNNRKYSSLPSSRRADVSTRRMFFGACLVCPRFQRMTELEYSQIAASLHKLAMVLENKGDFDGAESQYRASLNMNRRIHGEDADHPDIARSLHQLAMILQKKGDFDEAEVQYRASLDMMRRIHGEDLE